MEIVTAEIRMHRSQVPDVQPKFRRRRAAPQPRHHLWTSWPIPPHPVLPLPNGPDTILGYDRLPEATQPRALRALQSHYGDLPTDWPQQHAPALPRTAHQTTTNHANQPPQPPAAGQPPHGGTTFTQYHAINDDDVDMDTPTALQAQADDELSQQLCFDDALRWWDDITPQQILATRHRAKTHIPASTVAMYNHTRHHLLQRMALPPTDPLHRAAGLAFSCLDFLIMAPNEDSDESNTHTIQRRLQLASDGHWPQLWAEAATPTAKQLRNTPNLKKLADRIKRLAESNEASRAIQLLRDTPPNTTDPDNAAKLQALFPSAPLPVAQNLRPHISPRDFHDHVQKALNKYPRLAGTGPLGTTYEHLSTLLSHDDVAHLYSTFLYRWLHNDVHADLLQLHLSGALAAKTKPPNGVRPVVAGSLHKKIAMRAALACHKDAIEANLGPNQYGQGKKAAAEKLFRLIEAATDTNPDNITISIDLKNEFSTMSRQHIYDVIAQHLPQLLPAAQLILTNQQQHYYYLRQHRHRPPYYCH